MELVIAIVITIVVYAVVTGFALFDIRRVRRFSSDADADADVQTTANSRVSCYHQTRLCIRSIRTVN